MNTLILSSEEADKAAEIIKNGGLVAIPTETVYGLAANALDGRAVAKIYKAKGRPSDNPLIVHVSEKKDILPLVADFSKKAEMLIDAFSPGPLTVILPKSGVIPKEVSGGLETVAVRIPSHPLAREIIKLSKVPLAAPSANLSGSPSPTSFSHTKNDLFGRIDAIVDGGDCAVGVESTVISLACNPPRLLRPGGITPEQIEAVIGKIVIDDAVVNPLKDGEKVESPGMKYKHYSPKARIIIVKGSDSAFVSFVNNLSLSDKTAVLCFDEDLKYVNAQTVSLGKKDDSLIQAKHLFDVLRKLDERGFELVYAHCPKAEGVGLAVYNRLIRAAGFEVIECE